MDAEARREVNRQNAQKSTGPRSPEGKARSRRNALKHGLTATVVDPGLDPSAVDEQGDGPAGGAATASGRAWLVGQVGRVRAQIEHAGQVEVRLRDLAAWRAGALWEEDGRAEAEEVGAALRRSPGRTVARLRRSPQGVDWLIGRWRLLARAVEGDGDWSEEQVRLAFDLLGTPDEGRFGPPGGPGREAPLDLARGVIAELEGLRPDVDEADELAQILAANDLRDAPTPELARLRRYEAALYRRLRWLLDELERPESAPAPRPAEFEPVPEPAPSGPAPTAGPVEPADDETKPADDETKPAACDPITACEPPAAPAPRDRRPDPGRLGRRERRKRRNGRRSA